MNTVHVPQDAMENPWRHLWEEHKCEEHGIFWEYDIVHLVGTLDTGRMERLACGCLNYYRPATPENCATATESLTARDKAKFLDQCVKYGIDLSILRRE
jgi:hypothetical protein